SPTFASARSAESLGLLNPPTWVCQVGSGPQTIRPVCDLPWCPYAGLIDDEAAMLRTVSGRATGTTDAHRETAMTRIPTFLGLLALGGCYAEAAPAVQYTTPEPTMVAGPPGGGMDRPAYAGQYGQYQDPNLYQADPNGGEAPAEPYGGQDPSASVDPYSQQAAPQDPNATMGSVDDNEINQTLAPYGSWQEVDGYGRVWRPNATV